MIQDYKKPSHLTWFLLLFFSFAIIPGINLIVFGIPWLIDIHNCKKHNKMVDQAVLIGKYVNK